MHSNNTLEKWEEKTLEQLGDILDSQRKPITKRDRIAGEYPYYGATGLQDMVAEYIFDEPLVLIGEDGAKWGAGDKTAYGISGKCWVNNHAHVFRPNRTLLLDNYLINYLTYIDLKPFITGATVEKLNQEKLRSIPIPLPSLSEQQRIVGILDEAFENIEKAKQNAEQNLNNAKELFESTITSLFLNLKFKPIKLMELADVSSGYAFKSKDFVESGDYQVIRLGNVKQGFLRLSANPVYVTNIAKDVLSKSLLKIGNAVITQTGTKNKRDYGFVAIVNTEDLLLNQRLAVVRFKDLLIPKYFYYYSYTNTYKDDFFANEGGTVGQGNVGLNDIKNLSIPYIDIFEQQKIVQQLDELQEQTKKLEQIYTQKLQNLDELKQSILQKAFNGKL